MAQSAIFSAGQLDRRIRIEQRTDTSDTFGEPVATWSLLAVVWAEVQRLPPTARQERYVGAELVAEADTRFRIRYRAGVTTQVQVVYEGTTYEVLAINEMGRRQGLELLSRAWVA